MASVLGVLLAGILRRREERRLAARGLRREEVDAVVHAGHERPPVNWWILGGSLAFAAVSVSLGLGRLPYAQELVFGASLGIVLFLMARLVRELEPDARNTLVGTALLVFVFRALPGPGAGSTWWMIDELKFDQQFLSVLSLIGSVLTLAGLFIFRRFMAERSMAYIIGFLTVLGSALGAAHRRDVLRPARVDGGAHRRRRGRAFHRAGGHRPRVAPRPDRDGADARGSQTPRPRSSRPPTSR